MEKIEIIRQFIADEEAALAQNEQGSFYPSNHHHLSGAIKKLPKEISEDELVLLYFHLLRLGNRVKPPDEKHYLLLQRAFEKLLTILDARYPANMYSKLETVFVFDAMGPEDTAHVHHTGLTEYLQCQEVILQSNKYSNLPGMRSKPDKFLPYAQNSEIVARIIHTLQRTEFRHYGPLTSNFTFWGFIFILILNKGTEALNTLAAFADVKTDLPDKRSYIWILGSFLKDRKKDNEITALLQNLYTWYPKEWIDEYH
jgi:hypothetical protein